MCAVALAQGHANAYQVYGDNPARYIALADAMEADGYEFGEVGQAVNETLRKDVYKRQALGDVRVLRHVGRVLLGDTPVDRGAAETGQALVDLCLLYTSRCV